MGLHNSRIAHFDIRASILRRGFGLIIVEKVDEEGTLRNTIGKYLRFYITSYFLPQGIASGRCIDGISRQPEA